MKLRAYLDNNATTQLAPEALAAMMPYLSEVYLNASSAAGELMGAARPIINAKRALGRLFGDESLGSNFILTSGASEANSWAVHVATSCRAPGHIVSTAIEHPSLMAAFDAQRSAGWSVALAAPRATGRIECADVCELLRPDTALVSVMLANNETGVVQPIADIGNAVRTLCPDALFHVDATQAIGRIPVSLDHELVQVDLLSLSAHKFHGPKGVGALFASEGTQLPALIHGSQEDGRRGGTLNTAAAAGLAAAAELACERLSEMARVAALRDRFEHRLAGRVKRVRVLGLDVDRLPNTSTFSIPCVDAREVVEALAADGIVIASGSACLSGALGPSHVMTAMGLDYTEAKSVLRISLSRQTSEAELMLALEHICSFAQLPA